VDEYTPLMRGDDNSIPPPDVALLLNPTVGLSVALFTSHVRLCFLQPFLCHEVKVAVAPQRVTLAPH